MMTIAGPQAAMRAFVLMMCVSALMGCGPADKKPKTNMGPPDVSVVTLQTEAVNLSTE